jgi:arsenate reductase
MTATIFHNPNCSTSRKVLAALREAGQAPTVVEYLKTGWTKAQLQDLLTRMGAEPRAILRTKEAMAKDLAGASDEAVLEAMIAHPVLVERPIVVTGKGVALCRPADRLQALL